MAKNIVLATIGYEHATPASFVEALRRQKVELLVDVRAVSSSRRPGFSKSKLAATLNEAGIDYLHLRGLGTPAEGRAAARSGRHEEMLRIYREHLETDAARADLDTLVDIVNTGKHVALMCLEADPTHCHRSVVAREVAERVPVRIVDLDASVDPGRDAD